MPSARVCCGGGEGNSREAIRPFFGWPSEEGGTHIEAVAMDMHTAPIWKCVPSARTPK